MLFRPPWFFLLYVVIDLSLSAFRQTPDSPWHKWPSFVKLPQYQCRFSSRSIFFDSNKQLSIGRNADMRVRGQKWAVSCLVLLLEHALTLGRRPMTLVLHFYPTCETSNLYLATDMGIGDFIIVGVLKPLEKMYPRECSFLWLSTLPCWIKSRSNSVYQHNGNLQSFLHIFVIHRRTHHDPYKDGHHSPHFKRSWARIV